LSSLKAWFSSKESRIFFQSLLTIATARRRMKVIKCLEIENYMSFEAIALSLPWYAIPIYEYRDHISQSGNHFRLAARLNPFCKGQTDDGLARVNNEGYPYCYRYLPTYSTVFVVPLVVIGTAVIRVKIGSILACWKNDIQIMCLCQSAK